MASYDLFGDPTAGYAVNSSTLPSNTVNYTPPVVPVTPAPASTPSSAVLNAGSTWSSSPSPSVSWGGGGTTQPRVDPIGSNIAANPTYTAPSASVAPVQPQPSVLDYNTIVKNITDGVLANMPKYVSPYDNNMTQTLNKIQSLKGYQFDANNPALLQAQQQAMGQVNKDMARKGRVFDTYAATKEQEAAQGLLPSYYQLGMNQYNADRTDLYNQLGAIQTMDNTAYNRNQQQNQNYIQAYGLGQQGAQTQFNQAVQAAPLTGMFDGKTTIAEKDRIRNQELEQYGTPLTPEIRQQVTVFQGMPQAVRSQVQQYSNDYAAEINRRAAVNPQDPMIPYLLAARTNKILSSPELMQKYGSTIGLASPAIATMAQKYQKDQIALYIEQLKAKYAEPQYQAELEKIKAEALKNGAEAAYKQLEVANLPLKLKYELMQELEKINLTKAQTGAQQANAAESYANVALRGEQMNTEKSQQVKYLADATKAQKESFDYKGYDALNKHIQDTYYKGNSTATNTEVVDESGNSTKTNSSTSQKQISVEDKDALKAYLLRMKADPNVDQDIVKALMVTHNIK